MMKMGPLLPVMTPSGKLCMYCCMDFFVWLLSLLVWLVSCAEVLKEDFVLIFIFSLVEKPKWW